MVRSCTGWIMTPEDLHAILELRIKLGQGYLLGRPEPGPGPRMAS
jgi:EAL domain-containing protein (putative c-di-GMP-specific phosphodiesterase class I)